MIDLAERDGRVAVFAEVLWQRDVARHDAAQRSVQVVDAGGVGAQSTKQRRAGGSAQRLLRVRTFEQQPLRRQSIDTGSYGARASVGADLWSEIVHDEQEDIHSRRHGLRCGHGERLTPRNLELSLAIAVRLRLGGDDLGADVELVAPGPVGGGGPTHLRQDDPDVVAVSPARRPAVSVSLTV